MARENRGGNPFDNNKPKIPEKKLITIHEACRQLFLLLKEVKTSTIKRQIRDDLRELNIVMLKMLVSPEHHDHRVMAQVRAEGLVVTIKEFYNGAVTNDNDVLKKMEDHIMGPVMNAIFSDITVKF